MFGRCALRLRQCIHFPRQRGFFQGAALPDPARLLQGAGNHASREAEAGNSHKRRGAKQAYRPRVLGYQGAR